MTEVLGLSSVEDAIGLRANPPDKLVSAVLQTGEFRPRSNSDGWAFPTALCEIYQRGDHNGTPPLEGDCGEDSAEPVAKTGTKSSATARRTKEPEPNYIGALSRLDPHWSARVESRAPEGPITPYKENWQSAC